uniref:recombinase family protein n=1 Tax=uncultured Draconibacterium sp. TaxID=1573823 RepID=UPI0032179BFF
MSVAYYMRTSHYLQNIATQVDKIEPGWKIYEDKGISGRLSFEDRPAGKRLLEDIKSGKISEVKVLRIDRLGRSVQNILDTISYIHSYKVPIASLNEGVTTLDANGKQTPVTGLLVNVLSSLSEFFYHQNREKVLSGIERAKLIEGKYQGRKHGSAEKISKYKAKPKVKKIKELIEKGVGVRSICRTLECSPNSVYKVMDVYKLREK